jgi:endonuclease YncB( thermonuclease family)
MNATHFLAGIILVGTFAAIAVPDTISGPATITDGDTIRIRNNRIRLWGIDAPERTQAYGPDATDYLQRLTQGKEISCTKQDTDKYGRVVAKCFTGDHDLGRDMIAAGLAIDYTRYSHGYYKDVETTARIQHLGMWTQPKLETPEHYRHRQ